MKYIDAHSHIWTRDTEKYRLAAGYFRANMDPPSFTVEELQTNMKQIDVNRVVLIQMSFYGFDNSYMLDAIRDNPGMFSGVAVVDQDALRPDLTMIELKNQGVRGFRIYPKNKPPKNWLDGEAMRTMFDTGTKERLQMCCLINPDALPALDRMCRDFPETPVVIDHICRIGVSGKVMESDVKALCDMAAHKNVTVKISAFYALGRKTPPYHDLAPLIKRVHEAYGAERLMWASDAPFQVVGGHTHKASIDLIHGLEFLSADDKEQVLTKTSERVFF